MASITKKQTIAVLIGAFCLIQYLVSALPCNDQSCKPPSCRCWDNKRNPGEFSRSKTPQIVLLNYGNSINRATKHYPVELMDEIKNPNGCPALATFFIEQLNTDPREVKKLYERGHEIALSLKNDTIPRSADDWMRNIRDVKMRLVEAGIPEYSIRGFRSSQLYAGGDELMDVLAKLGLKYDSTCVNRHYVDMDTTLWPYTYDFPEHTPHCLIGETPRHVHNGTWQIPMPVLRYRDSFCSSPSGCNPYMNKTVTNSFVFLFENFIQHYSGNRAPFNLYLDPMWLADPKQFKGTKEFLKILADLNDVWFVTFQQALFWMTSPVDRTDAINYPPWGCGRGDLFTPNSRK